MTDRIQRFAGLTVGGVSDEGREQTYLSPSQSLASPHQNPARIFAMFRRDGQNGNLSRQAIQHSENSGEFGSAMNYHNGRTRLGRKRHRLDPTIEAEGFEICSSFLRSRRGDPSWLEIWRVYKNQIEPIFLVAYPFGGIASLDTHSVFEIV